MSVPAFSDIAKASNDVCEGAVTYNSCILMHIADTQQRFLPRYGWYARQLDTSCEILLTFGAANLDIKSKAPNGVTFNVKGKASHEGKNAGSVSSAPRVLD